MRAYHNAEGENEFELVMRVWHEWKEPGESGDCQGRAGRALQAGGLPGERPPVMRERPRRSLFIPTHLPNSGSQWCI